MEDVRPLSVRDVRRQKKITQEQLAAQSGVARLTINRIESGFQVPSFDTQEKLAKALEVPVDQIFFGESTVKRGTKEQLGDELIRLRAEVEQTKQEKEELRAMVNRLMGQVESLLAKSERVIQPGVKLRNVLPTWALIQRKNEATHRLHAAVRPC
jgi:transcriptional regulator with XRE-family HTH domain